MRQPHQIWHQQPWPWSFRDMDKRAGPNPMRVLHIE